MWAKVLKYFSTYPAFRHENNMVHLRIGFCMRMQNSWRFRKNTAIVISILFTGNLKRVYVKFSKIIQNRGWSKRSFYAICFLVCARFFCGGLDSFRCWLRFSYTLIFICRDPVMIVVANRIFIPGSNAWWLELLECLRSFFYYINFCFAATSISH